MGRRGQCFRTSSGCGKIELKCQGIPPQGAGPLTLVYRIGSGKLAQNQRGPVIHDFNAASVARLQEGEDEWNFKLAVDPQSASFDVCVEVHLQEALSVQLRERVRGVQSA